MKIRITVFHHGKWCGSLIGKPETIRYFLAEYYPAELGFAYSAPEIVKA